jgi:MFS family permease
MTQTIAAPVAPARSRPRARGLLTILLLGQFMAILDVTIVNVAAPTLRADLHASGAGLQLVISGYTIAYAVLLITGARLGALAGHRRMFQAGLAMFTLASLACGLAPSTGLLIAFRVVQGAGAALMVPQVLSLIQRHYAGPARARALGVYGAVIACAAIAGQVLGGVLVSADLAGSGWRPAFLINVPVGVALFAVGRRLLPSDETPASAGNGRRLDLAGVLALAAAVLAFVLPLVLGHETGWPTWTWLSLGGSAVLGAVFAGLQRRVNAPLIPSRVLRAPGLLPAVTALLVAMATYAGFLFTLALHVQLGLGYRALPAGLVLVPGAVAFAVSSLNWRRFPPRWYPRLVVLGLVVGAAGYTGLSFTVRGGGGVGWGLELALTTFGLGFGAAFSPLIALALSRVPPADAADASGVLATVTQLGQVIGIATFGTLYLSVAGGPAHAGSAHAAAVTFAVLGAGAMLSGLLAMLQPGIARVRP